MIVLIYAALIILEIMFSVQASIGEEQLLALPKKVNQQDAVHLCQQHGMRLIRVEDEQTNQIVYNFAVKRGLGQYWIDANDRAVEGQWVYEDGNRITYSKWHPGEPNNWNKEDCLHGSFYGNGFWNDIRCDIQNAVICYRDKASAVVESLSESQLLALPQKVKQQDAVHLCRQQGMNLIKVQDEQTNQIVYDFAVKRGLGQYWMDANDRLYEGQWVYEDGNRITYSKWHPGEPNNWNKEDCLHGAFHGNGFWNDIRCDINNAVICYRDKASAVVDVITEDQLLALNFKGNQQQAVQQCKDRGMSLIKVQDEGSNMFVFKYAVDRGLGQYWMDANDRLYEGQWVYEDGNKITYSKWHPGEPNNWNKEDCLHGLFYQHGFWNDITCNANIAIICYRPKSAIKIIKIQENQLVPLPNKVNYQEAVNLCKAKGLSLIKIQNEETNQMVYNFAIQKGLGQYWIDANDKNQEGTWRYENGEHITYSKWHPGEPNNWNKEDCLHGLYYKNGYWNDVSCAHNNAVICYEDSSSIKIDTETETKPETKTITEIKPETKTITDTKTITETVSIYLTAEKSNYDDAVQYCKNQNLRLIRIDSAELNKLVVEMITTKSLGTYWIDGNDRKETDVWLDSDGNKLKYKNFKVGVSRDSDDSHCINGFSFQNEQWNIASCDSKHAVICF